MSEPAFSKETPLDISVVLPVYNGENYLRASIDSVLNQAFESFELIIWDDGSTDDSRKIAGSYSDLRLRCFANPSNLGLFKTLNFAIAQSRGSIIKLWSQDDLMKPKCLEKGIDFLSNNPSVSMAYCTYDTIDDQGRVVRPATAYPTHPTVIEPKLASHIMFYNGSISGNIANVFIRKSALSDVGLFKEELLVSGDFEMWVRLTEKWPIGFMDEPLIYLRSHDKQFSRQNGVYPKFMHEDSLIFETLLDRLPDEIKGYARRYDRRQRQLQYVHYLIGCLMRREWKRASEAYREIRKISEPFSLVALWLFTLDQRFFKLKPKYPVAVDSESNT